MAGNFSCSALRQHPPPTPFPISAHTYTFHTIIITNYPPPRRRNFLTSRQSCQLVRKLYTEMFCKSKKNRFMARHWQWKWEKQTTKNKKRKNKIRNENKLCKMSLMKEHTVVTHRCTDLQETEKLWQILNWSTFIHVMFFYEIVRILFFKYRILTEGVFVTQLTSIASQFDELCAIRQTAVSRAIQS
jgi:hypothetical protein